MSISEKLREEYKLAVRGDLGYESKDRKGRLTGDRKEQAYNTDFLRRTLEEYENQGLGFRLYVIVKSDIGSVVCEVFDPKAIKKFLELEKAGRKAEFFRDFNEDVYEKLMKFRERIESDKPIDQELLLAVQRRMKDFESWFIRNGFEVPEFVEIVDDDDMNTGIKFSHSDDYISIVFHKKQYVLTPLQAKVVEILHQNYERGTPDVQHAYVLEKIDYAGKRLRDIFKKSELWGTLIVSVRKGVCRLNP